MKERKKIIFATGNAGKLKEVKNIFEDSDIEIVGLSDLGEVPEIDEHGSTFEENSLIKAKEIFVLFGLPVVADDSGLEIDQLDGRPGVISARYSGENCSYDDNNNKVLSELEAFPQPHKARFVSCAVYFDGEVVKVANGYLEGEIIKEKRGTNGFGYDPIFVPSGFDKTLSEFSLEEKNQISHRKESFEKLKLLIDAI